MPSRLHRHSIGRLAAILFLTLLAASSAFAQERADCHPFRSAILHSSVHYCVFLPANYSSPATKAQRYPVLYILHGLGCGICGGITRPATSWSSRRTDGTPSTSIRGTARLFTEISFYASSCRSSSMRIASARNAPRGGSPDFPWEATERCALDSLILNCSARSAPTAPR